MTICFQNRRAGLALTEVVVLIATLVLVLSFLFIFRLARVSNSSNRITCVNNLKQIHLSFRIYAGDNRDRFPMNISTNEKPVVNEATPVYQYFKLTENELGTPKVVICPSDTNRIRITNFISFDNSNVSYFIGLDSNESLTNSMVAGDRNISNGTLPENGLLRLTAKQKVGFTKDIHKQQGNIALGDGSVRQITSKQLHSEILPNTGLVTNRILQP